VSGARSERSEQAGDAESADRRLLTDLALARGVLDRAGHLRGDEDVLAGIWADDATRVLLVDQGLAPMERTADGPRLHFLPPGRVPRSDTVERCLLGRDDDGVAYVAARPDHGMIAPIGTEWAGLREIGADLGDRDAGILVTAIALDNWHDTHRHCARCGAATVPASGGWLRRCPADGSEHYPRTDPAVIVLVRDGEDRALLGRQARWPRGWFSTLAGFVEPGESAEAAVRREVAEESGVPVGDVVYLGSQPWPFPGSLMLGYHAWTDRTQITVDGEEIAEALWFSRDELVAACTSGDVVLPPAVSIARRLIERWYGSPLPGAWSRPPVAAR
jgi:NAD+ diphosphatase